MAAYGVKYEIKFSDNRGHKRTLEILKKDYEGDILSLVGTETPAILRYSSSDDIYNPIIGSSCIVNLKTTDNISYDEFQNFNERDFKIRILAGQEDNSITLDSPLWNVANTDWEQTDLLWQKSEVFEVYWEGFLVFDNYNESIISKPFDIKLKAIDNLGTLDSYLVPNGNINLNADGSIKTTSSDQNNFDSAFYYIKEILKLTGLDFDIFIQNNIRRKINNVVIDSNKTIFHDIFINEFALTDDFVRKNAKNVLKQILKLTNSRIYQANASWYIVSNSNYYDRTVIAGVGSNTTNKSNTSPLVTTNSPSNITETSVTLSGTVTNDRGLPINTRGFYFGESNQYSNNLRIESTETTSTFTLNQSNLIAGRQYFVTAFATNSLFDEGRGATNSFIASTTTTTQGQVQTKATVVTVEPTNNQIFDDKMTLTGRVEDIGSSNVTQVGFYFGTNSFNYTQNRRIPQTVNYTGGTNQFTLDTSSVTSPALTLTPGTQYYINAFAVNTAGESVGSQVKKRTHNIWKVVNASTNAVRNAVYDDTYSSGTTITLSDTGATCYTITSGATIASTSGLPTISGVCITTTQEITTEEITTCLIESVFGAASPYAVCCNDIAAKNVYINGANLYSDETTKVFTDDTCSTLVAAQYFANDGQYYRYFNGTTLGSKILCPECDPDVDNPVALIVENETTGQRINVAYNSNFDGSGSKVRINTDNDNCYIVQGSIDLGTTPTTTIVGSCDIVTTQPAETCPTMTFFANYQGCGDDQIEIFGRNKNELPDFVKQISTGICFFKVGTVSTEVQNDNNNLGCFPTSKFQEVDLANNAFLSCDDCEGVTTTQLPSTTTSTTAAPTIFYRKYLGLNTDCSQDDIIIEVSNQTNSFPAVISDGVVCYSSHSNGGAGVDGDVDEYLNFADCNTCQLYLATTTTPAPITTQTPCTAIQVYIGNDAVTACCGGRAVTAYVNGTSLANSSTIYTDFLCTEIIAPGNYIRQANTTYFWNGFSLTLITCPACP